MQDLCGMNRYKRFDDIFENYYTKLYCHAFSFLHDPETSCDVVNDTFEVLWRNFSKAGDDNFLGSYLYSIVRHKCIDILRRQMIHERFVNNNDIPILFREDYDYTHYDSRLELLKRHIESLPEKTRKVFVMCHLDGYSYQEAALLLNISLNTVKTLLSRAMKILREVSYPQK